MEQKVQEIFEKVRETATAAALATGKMADVASKKMGELVSTTKTNLQIFDLNTDIEVLYKEIGKSVFLTHTGVAANPVEIEEKIAEIDSKYQKIASLKAANCEIKASLKCPECGKACAKNDAFCSDCGYQF